VKSIFVGDDESVVFTGGMDSTLRLWDVGKRAVIKVYGSEE
jgi:WD40 repeat protein